MATAWVHGGEPARHTADVACWTEWKRRCALALCAGPTRNRLLAFARLHFRAAARKCRGLTNLGHTLRLPSRAEDMWHILETHMNTGRTRQGKRYKDWLFARAGAPGAPDLNAIEGGAALLMRTAVRYHVRAECLPPAVVSLSTPVSARSGVPLTLEDLLPGNADPSCEAARRDIRRIARRRAAGWLKRLSRPERAALLAAELNLHIGHPAVLAAAGSCRQTVSRAYTNLMIRLVHETRARHPVEDRSAVLMLILETAAALRAAVLDWAPADRKAARLLKYAAAPEAGGPP
ncbi:MAG: hypothetical protein JW951_04770 [Lentisphaerae bacterium]|nr:hypothetical protein [Lentisphaerota bacterium]